jgi:hypothetical protein
MRELTITWTEDGQAQALYDDALVPILEAVARWPS